MTNRGTRYRHFFFAFPTVLCDPDRISRFLCIYQANTDQHTGRVIIKSKYWIHITHKGPAYDMEGTVLGGSGTSPLPIQWTTMDDAIVRVSLSSPQTAVRQVLPNLYPVPPALSSMSTVLWSERVPVTQWHDTRRIPRISISVS